MPEREILTCRGVRMAYGGRTVVEDVSLALERGECLCVVGENGSGKTTLMKGMLGLLPLSGGEIELKIELDKTRRAGIGYMPQQAVQQRDFPASVREVVLSGRLNRHGLFPFYTRGDRASADENIRRLGLASEAGKSYRDLSGGQRQRVLLARALCAAGELLMLDEPASGLDPVVASDMYGLLKKLNQDGMTLVIISHNMKTAALPGWKVLHMNRKPLFFGPSEEYVKTELYSRMSGLTQNAQNGGGDFCEP